MRLWFKDETRDYVTVLKKRRPIMAPISWGTIAVPGRPGVVLTDKIVEPVTIPVTILVDGNSRSDYLRKAEDLAKWLSSDSEQPLRFDDDNRTYQAVVQGSFDPDEIVSYGKVEISFFCADPYKYGPEETANFVDGIAVLDNAGTIPAAPYFRAEVLSDITHVDVFTDTEYMRIGQPADLGTSPVLAKETLLHNTMTNGTGTSTLGVSVDGGSMAGSFGYGTTSGLGNYFYANSFGTGTAWHGPGAKQSVPNSPVQDFTVEVLLKLPWSSGKGVARAEVYLLDDQSQSIGKLAVVKNGNQKGVKIEIRIGGGSNHEFIVNHFGDSTAKRWNNFYGILRLTKKGNVYEAYVAQINTSTKKHFNAFSNRFVDEKARFTGTLAQVQPHIGAYGTNPVITGTQIHDIKVIRHNNVPDTDPRVIATTGDIVEIDFKANAIYLNGEERKDLKDLGSYFYKIKPGDQAILVEPSDKLNASISIKEGWL